MSSVMGPAPLAQDAALAEAVAALRAGRPQDAISRLESLAGAPDASFDVLHTLGIACAQAGRMEPAARWLEQAVARRPRHAPALFNLGQALGRLNRREEARAALQRAVDADPGYAKARAALAQLGPAPPARALPAGMAACPRCGAANPEGYFTCSLCGEPAPRPAAGSPPGAARPQPAPDAAPAGEAEEGEWSPEQEKQDLRVAAMLAGAVFGGCALLNAWKAAQALSKEGPQAFVIALGGVMLVALVPFVASLGVFMVMGVGHTFWQRLAGAGIVAASRLCINALWVLVINPLFGVFLNVLTFGLGGWLLSFCAIYITTLTVVEKVLDAHLEQAHGVAWAIIIATFALWCVLYFVAVAAAPALLMLLR